MGVRFPPRLPPPPRRCKNSAAFFLQPAPRSASCRLLTRLRYGVPMSLKNLHDKSQSDVSQSESSPPDEIFHWEQDLHHIFPHAPARRLAHALAVNPRLGQKWAAGKEFPSQRAQDFVSEQSSKLSSAAITAVLERLIQEWHDAGVHEEVIAAQLAALHERLTDRSIE